MICGTIRESSAGGRTKGHWVWHCGPGDWKPQCSLEQFCSKALLSPDELPGEMTPTGSGADLSISSWKSTDSGKTGFSMVSLQLLRLRDSGLVGRYCMGLCMLFRDLLWQETSGLRSVILVVGGFFPAEFWGTSLRVVGAGAHTRERLPLLGTGRGSLPEKRIFLKGIRMASPLPPCLEKGCISLLLIK